MPQLTQENFQPYAERTHDAKFEQLIYDYDTRSIAIRFSLEWEHWAKMTLTFQDVRQYEGTLDEPWGASPHVLSWKLIPKEAMQEFRETETSAPDEAVLVTEMQFSSGNVLRVLCGGIAWEDAQDSQ